MEKKEGEYYSFVYPEFSVIWIVLAILIGGVILTINSSYTNRVYKKTVYYYVRRIILFVVFIMLIYGFFIHQVLSFMFFAVIFIIIFYVGAHHLLGFFTGLWNYSTNKYKTIRKTLLDESSQSQN
jgi:glucan phosphoethanolaminetransferase (alkaline phosphatase superfamily)